MGRELTDFLELIYGVNDGYVYAATKEADGTFGQTYFGWPAQQDALVRFVQEKSPDAEVYVCPSLFGQASGLRVDVIGSNVVWADFDNGTPESWGNLPEPNVVVESSPGRHHCYWLLDQFTPPGDVDKINRKLAYAFEADLGGWDANQLLRPPETINHKRGGKNVKLIQVRIQRNGSSAFGVITEPPPLLSVESFGKIPEVADVIRAHQFPDDAWNKFKAGAEKPNRSTALAHLGYSFAEMGMTNEELMAMLLNVASRMGKFEGRDSKRLIADLITKVRIKVPLVDSDETDFDLTAYSPSALMALTQKIDWVMKPFIHSKGLSIMTGPPGIGKSQLNLSLQQCLALGIPFLEYEVARPRKMGFLSLEMPPEELQLFLGNQLQVYDSDQRKLLDENLVLFPLGVPINLGEGPAQNYVMRLVEENQLDGLIIDSLSSCTPNELSSDKESKALLNFDVYLRKKYGIFTTYIHHNRKAQSDNKRPNKLSDVFGSGMMIIRPSMITTMWSESNGRIEFKPLKVRLGAIPVPFHISRTPEFHFTRQAPLQGLTITKGGEKVVEVVVDHDETQEGGENAGSGKIDF